MADASPPPAKIPRTKSPSPPITDAASAPAATVSAAQQFSDEVWEEILSHCSIFDLFCLRDTQRLFRTIIDWDMIIQAFADARLFLVWPYNEQAWARLCTNGCDPLCYMKMLCVGPCSICGTWSALPPVANDLRIRFCGSEACSSYMFSEYMTSGWSASRRRGWHTYDVRQDAACELPSKAECWQPHMLMDIKRYNSLDHDLAHDIRGSTNCRTLHKSRLTAKRELEGIGWKGGSYSDILRDSTDKEGAKRLESIYNRRCARMEITEGLYCDLVSWRLGKEHEDPQIRQKNYEIIRKRAEALNQPFDHYHPFIERVVEAHARDVSEIHLAAAERLFPLPAQPKGPWHPDFDHPYTRNGGTRIPWPRSFVPFMYRHLPDPELTRGDLDDYRVGGPKFTPALDPAPAPNPAPAPEPAPAPDPGSPSPKVIVTTSGSDDDAGLDRTPGDNHTPSGSARKNAPGRSSKARAKARRTKQENSDPKAWYTCTLCESETRKYESQDELEEHIAKGHSSASAFTVS